jgi:tetratricopeptide (TPR) repeat protein
VNELSAPRQPETRWPRCLGGAVIAAGAVAAYRGSFHGPFLFDDVGTITGNPSIHHLWTAFLPPESSTAGGRPVLNLSLAVNYALGGLDVRGFHALNLVIHILAGLTLFGVVARLLRLSARFAPASLPLAFATALIWTVHPLQTESVTYIVQRAESLMGLFYLLTLYCFIRYAEGGARSPSAPVWAILSIGVCLAGMGTKEVMVTAPVVVFLCDRTFFSGSFREAWRRHGRVHAGLAATWLLLGYLVFTTHGRAGTAGFSSGVAWWAYALTQFRAVATYLRLSVWPHPLIADYGRILGGPPVEVVLDAAGVACLVGTTAWAVGTGRGEGGSGGFGHRAAGFAGAFFLLVLAPSSSVFPIVTEIIAEHRMYLPLAAVVAVAVCSGYTLLRGTRILLPLCVLVAVGFALLTDRRNAVYQSSLVFWSDAVRKVPQNAGARNNLGNTLAEEGKLDAAMAEYLEALRLVPDYSDAHTNLGSLLVREGRPREAVGEYLAALRFYPRNALIHDALGVALLRSDKIEEARREFEEAVRLDPAVADAWSNLGDLLIADGKLDLAADAYGKATRLRPGEPDGHVNFGNVLAQLGRRSEAMREYQTALGLQPAAADVHNNLGSLLAQAGRYAEARAEMETALRLKPDYREARDNLEHVEQLEKAESGR